MHKNPTEEELFDWCTQRKQNTHRSRDKRVCDVFGELQALVGVVGTKRTKAGPG